MNLIPFIIILIFSCLWTAITNKYLPSETLDKKGQQDRYDERQRKMFIEILAKSFIWIVYCMLFTLVLKLQVCHQVLKDLGFLNIQKFSL